MVCLKAKKKSDDGDSGGQPQSEIKLLEIISNCNWEENRTNMLSKISHIISKGREGMMNSVVMWQNYILQFLPRANKPAIIPPELARTLPNPMYSIRVRVTQKYGDYIEKIEKDRSTAGNRQSVHSVDEKDKVENMDDSKSQDAMEETERKQQNVKLQKKLIDKIKFAEKLRDLIITEEKKGADASKFSVSLDGIQKALKKYKTQLWKAYTGSNNMTLMQLKKAVAAAKSGNAGAEAMPDRPAAAMSPTQSIIQNVAFQQHDMNATLARITANQGLKIVCPKPSGGSFIPISNMAQSHASVISPKNMESLASIPGNVLVMPKSQIIASTAPNTPATSSKQRTIANKPGPNHLPSPSCVVNAKPDSGVPVSGTGISRTSAAAEVLLIPVPDSRNSNWDPLANPVLSAKMTMLSNGSASPVTIQNGTSVMSKVVNAQGAGVIPMVPTTASQPVRLGSPGVNPSLVPCQPLNGQPIILQTSQAGKPPIMLNAIQPVSTASSMYNPVQVIGQSMKICVSSVSGQVSKTSPAVSQVPCSTMKNVFPTMTAPGFRSPGPAGSMPGSTMCSVYPIRLAPPANTSFSTTNPISSVSSGPRCINPVPVQLVPNKNFTHSNLYAVVPVSSQNALPPKTDSVEETGNEPIPVTNQSNLLNAHTDISKLNSNTDKPEPSGTNLNCSKTKLDTEKNGVVESVNLLKPAASVDKAETEKVCEDEQSVSNSVKENEDNVEGILNNANQAGIDIANAINLIDSPVKNLKDSTIGDSKKESSLATDDESDSCLIIDESLSTARQTSTSGDEPAQAQEFQESVKANNKRKMLATAGEGDEGSQAKKQCTGALPVTGSHVTLLSSTEVGNGVNTRVNSFN